jgi:hypothetical protein
MSLMVVIVSGVSVSARFRQKRTRASPHSVATLTSITTTNRSRLLRMEVISFWFAAEVSSVNDPIDPYYLLPVTAQRDKSLGPFTTHQSFRFPLAFFELPQPSQTISALCN